MLKNHPDFPSAYVAPRRVDVWLPPAYEAEERAHPVLYMHDGQNLFIPELSYTGVPWGVDKALTRLAAAGQAQPAIIVGVWNTPQRVAEYMPQKAAEQFLTAAALAHLAQEIGRLQADDYLRFLVTELKPFVDTTYRTKPEPAHTFIMGSSMGGLISAYALCEYPAVFGGAGCVSTHWPIGDGVMIEYLRHNLPDPATHKFYFDYGTEDVDAPYEPYQRRADRLMRAAGYTAGHNWITRKFPGAGHSEQAWQARVEIPLVFLLPD
jgi:predicted alpha/beta superfamily hydrolase